MLRQALFPLAVLSSPAFAQDALPTEADDEDPIQLDAKANDIVVIAERIKNQIDAPEQPIAVYDEADIEAYGASSIADLISSVSPQTGSGRGRGGAGGGFPAILFNGQRITNFRDMRNIQPEAIRRMEVLPEEVAVRYGFPPNQRVINFILKDHYANRSVNLEYHQPTLGGFSENQFEATLFEVDKANRLNLYLRSNDASMLTERRRGVIQQSVNPDQGPYRSLVPDTRDIIFNASWTRGLGEKGLAGALGLSAGYTRNDNLAFSGLNLAEFNATGKAVPLIRKTGTDNFTGGASLNRNMGQWTLTATMDASHVRTVTDTGRRVTLATSPGQDRARSNNTSIGSQLLLAGRPFALPAGDVGTTFKAGFAWLGIDSENSATAVASHLKRGDLSAGLAVTFPIASRRNNVLAGVGDLSLNASAGLNHLSDFGTLTDWSVGLVWSPAERLSLQASYIVNQAAPSLSDLGGPRIDTFNVPVFDFTRNETALVTTTSGGNRNLVREVQRDIKISANWTLPFLKNSNLIVEYFRNRSNDVTSAFPVLTPEIEAAFPGRVTRDANGRLVAIDRRAVTFAGTQGSRLRWGLNLSGSFGKAQEGRGRGMMGGRGGPPGGFGGPGGMRPPGPPAGGFPGGGGQAMGQGGPPIGGGGMRGGMRGGGGGPMMGMMGDGRGRWNLSVYHVYRFDETVRVAANGPVLDLLGGDALSGGGVARNSLEFEGGGFYRGMGLRLNGNWTAPTRVSDLRFGATFKVDLRAFINFDGKPKLVKAVPFLKGARIAIEVENLFESRTRVTDAAGAVPLSYQPDLIDPRGRIIGIEFRKSF